MGFFILLTWSVTCNDVHMLNHLYLLGILYNPFYVLLNIVYSCFVDDFCIIIRQRYCSGFLECFCLPLLFE